MASIDVVVQGYNYGSDQGRFGFSGIYLVRSRRNILVDTSHVGRRENLLQGLERLQVRLSDIDLVVRVRYLNVFDRAQEDLALFDMKGGVLLVHIEVSEI